MGGREEEVTVVESCMVTPSQETPRHGLWLSPLDVFKARCGHIPTVYLYRPESDAVHDFFDVPRLKAAMAEALVAFYPLAGRLGVDDDGRDKIDCASQGALFIVAHSNHDLNNLQASPELTRLFVPRVDDSPSVMCAVQVTFFKCGGVTLGTALHHAAIDAVSAFHFIQTWSTFSRDGNVAALETPCHDRTLLRARSPPFVLASFCPKQTTGELHPPRSVVQVVNEIFVISKDQVAALKHACTGTGTGGSRAESTFCVVTAHVWRCLCMARRLPPDTVTHLRFSANIRRRLRPPLPDSYFGNAIITVDVAGNAQDIIASEDNQPPLASVVSRIRGSITRMDDELVRSAVDYLELEITKGSQPPAPVGSLTNLWVVAWLGMPVHDTDFGWGRPMLMQRATNQQRPGVVHLMDDVDGNLRILVSVEHAVMDEFRRLFTCGYASTAK